jgi:hypothetical protein
MQVELNNMYANIGVNNSSEKLRTKQKSTATIGKLSKAVYASYVHVYIVQGGQVVWTAAGG